MNRDNQRTYAEHVNLLGDLLDADDWRDRIGRLLSYDGAAHKVTLSFAAIGDMLRAERAAELEAAA